MYIVSALHLRYFIWKDAWSSFCKECCARTSFDAFVCNRRWFHFCSSFHLQSTENAQNIHNKYHRMVVIKTFSFNNLRLHYCYIKAIRNYYVSLWYVPNARSSTIKSCTYMIFYSKLLYVRCRIFLVIILQFCLTKWNGHNCCWYHIVYIQIHHFRIEIFTFCALVEL